MISAVTIPILKEKPVERLGKFFSNSMKDSVVIQHIINELGVLMKKSDVWITRSIQGIDISTYCTTPTCVAIGTV